MEVYKYSDEKFKSINISYNFTTQVEDNSIYSQFSVLGALLAKGSNRFKNQKEIEKYLSKLYGANFHIDVEKIADLYNMEFTFEFVNKEFLPNKEELLDKIIEFIDEIIYKPADWNEENIEREKEFILERIKERKDEKLRYGVQRMEELLCVGEPFGNFLHGDVETVEKIDKEELKSAYTKLLNCPVTVLVSGNLKGYEDIDKIIMQKLSKYTTNTSITSLSPNVNSNCERKYEEIKEYVETSQSVVSLGYRINGATSQDFYALTVYNAILGTTPSSKLFQNVREKNSLCYTVRSKYYRLKNLLIVFAGINNDNYKKAVNTINEQVEDMKKGNISQIEFTTAKDSILADFSEMNDLKFGVVKLIFTNLIAQKNSNSSIEELKEKIRNVTIEDVIRVANMITLEKVLLLGGGEDA